MDAERNLSNVVEQITMVLKVVKPEPAAAFQTTSVSSDES
jgi:hypothetical protein